jgi:hypothetical protein
MYKLIVFLAAAMPIILFLRTVFLGRSKVMKEASANFRRQVDYLVWAILFAVGCSLAYTIWRVISSTPN